MVKFLHGLELEDAMAEVLVQFNDTFAVGNGGAYVARACGAEAPDGKWQGWIEFTPADGGATLRTGRETTQPNRQDTLYWATGLTPVYLEGALKRALAPRVPAPESRPAAPTFDGPAGPPSGNGVLNPFSVIEKGEAVLRGQLKAMSSWHLVNIARAHALTDLSADALGTLSHPELVELIVIGVKTTPQGARASRGR